MSEYTSVDDLRNEIIGRYSGLSKRLQQVGKYVIDSQNDFAIETVATIAERSGVQPSAVIRFAKEFGFEGASSMQRLFRQKLISDGTSDNYRDRVRDMKRHLSSDGDETYKEYFYDLIDESVESLSRLGSKERAKGVVNFAQAIDKSDVVYLAGVRRSFPVSAYFAYGLGKAGKRAIVIDGAGGMEDQMIDCCSPADLMIATTFSPYAEETVTAAERAKKLGCKIAVISDSEVSPLAKFADKKIFVQDAETFGFRALSSTLCIAQAIVVSYVAISEKK